MIRVDGNTGTVGISDYAQEELGEVVYVDLPELSLKFATGTIATISFLSSFPASCTSRIRCKHSGSIPEQLEDRIL